ncbi:hypothetical protein ACFLU6_07665 [Acidobacteriota bacterium]
MKKAWVCTMVIVICAGIAVPALSQNETGVTEEGSLTQEIADLNNSVKELVTLMKAFLEMKEDELEKQNQTLMLRRLNSSDRKIEPLQERLVKTRDRRAKLERNVTRMAESIAELDQAVKDNKSFRGVDSSEELKRYKREHERELQLARQEISELLNLEIQLEGELSTLQEDIETLEKTIDQHLGLR